MIGFCYLILVSKMVRADHIRAAPIWTSRLDFWGVLLLTQDFNNNKIPFLGGETSKGVDHFHLIFGESTDG